MELNKASLRFDLPALALLGIIVSTDITGAGVVEFGSALSALHKEAKDTTNDPNVLIRQNQINGESFLEGLNETKSVNPLYTDPFKQDLGFYLPEMYEYDSIEPSFPYPKLSFNGKLININFIDLDNNPDQYEQVDFYFLDKPVEEGSETELNNSTRIKIYSFVDEDMDGRYSRVDIKYLLGTNTNAIQTFHEIELKDLPRYKSEHAVTDLSLYYPPEFLLSSPDKALNEIINFIPINTINQINDIYEKD